MKLSPLASKSVSVWRRGLAALRLALGRLLASGSPPTQTVAHQGAASCKGAALATQKFPVDVNCFGRRYRVTNGDEFKALIAYIDGGHLALANRYRIGKSWPRGARSRTVRKWAHGPLWYCGDCDRSHRESTRQCPVSKRARDEIGTPHEQETPPDARAQLVEIFAVDPVDGA